MSECNPNSLLLWWPKIKDLGIPVPRTEIIPCDRQDIFAWMEDRGELPEVFLNQLTEAANRIGYPLFMRTDLCSGKHGWKKTCFVDVGQSLLQHLYGVCEENELASVVGLPYQAIVLREFLKLAKGFKAFYGDMPINREFRVFVRDGKMECIHPYWPHDAIRGHTKARYWNRKLDEMNRLGRQERASIQSHAEKAGKVLPGYWSLDFAQSAKNWRTWYLIDAATGDASFHWPECPMNL